MFFFFHTFSWYISNPFRRLNIEIKYFFKVLFFTFIAVIKVEVKRRLHTWFLHLYIHVCLIWFNKEFCILTLENNHYFRLVLTFVRFVYSEFIVPSEDKFLYQDDKLLRMLKLLVFLQKGQFQSSVFFLVHVKYVCREKIPERPLGALKYIYLTTSERSSYIGYSLPLPGFKGCFSPHEMNCIFLQYFNNG